jgi:glutathione S-transferase
MITLYQLHWSHYVEKVRWALDYKGIEWVAVDVDPFTKRQMQHLACMTTLVSGRQLYTVPAIHDAATGAVIADSAEILSYLERVYPTPALYGRGEMERGEVSRWMLWLDSTLGLGARRVAYTQIAVEHPGLLAELFVPHIVRAGDGSGLKARIAGSIIAGVLTRRFRFLHNRVDGVFEQIEQCLLLAAERLSARAYLVGDQFSAADITLAALLRPIGLVPFFRNHPRLQRLFEWRMTQLQAHRRESQTGYEVAMHETRRRRGWALGAVSWLTPSTRADGTEIPTLAAAVNDQQSIGRWPTIRGPLWHMQLKRTCGLGRTAYP